MAKKRQIPRFIAGRSIIKARALNGFRDTAMRFNNMRAGGDMQLLDAGPGPVFKLARPIENEINFGPWFTEVDPKDASKVSVGRQRGFDDYPFEDETRFHFEVDGDRILVDAGTESLAAATTGNYIYVEAEKDADDSFTVDVKVDTDKPDHDHADRDADIWWLILGKVISVSGGLITEYRRWNVGNWTVAAL